MRGCELFSVEVFSMNEGRYDLGYLLSLPLGSHMTNSMDSHELEVIVIDLVSRGLLVGDPWSPVLGHSPVLGLDPSPGTKSWNSTVSVSREEHHVVTIGLKNGIDPHGALILVVILEAVIAIAG